MKESTNFANGFNYFCTDCGMFFNVKTESDDVYAGYCPVCGDGGSIRRSADELLEHLEDNDTDPVNFYRAFPPDELIPNSRTGATPRQVSIIFELVTNRHDIPLTVESVAGNCGASRELVRKVFEEFHITEREEKK